MTLNNLLRFLIIGLLFLPLHMYASSTKEKVVKKHSSADQVFFANNDYGIREGLRTDGVMIWQNGQIIYQKYERGFQPQQKHILWSISKTITALLYGVAIREKLVRLDQSICDFVSVSEKAKCLIRIEDVLTWSTALNWNEEYENASEIKKSSVVAMLYGEGSSDMNHFVLSQPFVKASKPGEIWRYSSGDTLLAAKILAGVYKDTDLRKVFQYKLFTPLGITDWSCESDDLGVLGGAFYFYLTLPDLIKVGELLMGRGAYKNKPLIDEKFMSFMKTVPTAFKLNRVDHKYDSISGAHLWLNDPQASGLKSPWPEAPIDTVVARGHWGQYLVVMPSLKLIAARVGDTRDGSLKIEDFVRQVLTVAADASAVITTKPSASDAKTNATTVTSKAVPVIARAQPQERPQYRDGRVKLGLAFTAKNFCSCLFVSERTEANCRDYASLRQISPILSVDFKNKKTKSSWFYLISREAQYFENEKGCRLLPM